MNEQKPLKPDYKRRENGTFGKGNHANDLGRPKGISLKEFWRQRLSLMTDKEKEKYSRKLAKEFIWRMAEGNPQNDITSQGERIIPIPLLNGLSDNTIDKKDSGS